MSWTLGLDRDFKKDYDTLVYIHGSCELKKRLYTWTSRLPLTLGGAFWISDYVLSFKQVIT